MMVIWLLLALGLIVFIAPLRGALLGRGTWRFTLPALAGLGGAWAGWSYMRTMPVPASFGWSSILVPVFGALVIGGTVWTCLNDVFGPPRERN